MIHREFIQDHSYSDMLEQADFDCRNMKDETLSELIRKSRYILNNENVLLPLSTRPSEKGRESIYPDLSEYNIWKRLIETKQIVRVGGSHLSPKMLMELAQALGSALDELFIAAEITDYNLSGKSMLLFPKRKNPYSDPEYIFSIHGFSFGENKKEYKKKNRSDLILLIKFILISATLEKELRDEYEDEWKDKWDEISLDLNSNEETLDRLMADEYPPEMLAALKLIPPYYSKPVL